VSLQQFCQFLLKTESENPCSRSAVPKGLHAFACFAACCVFLLIIAGGLVTSNDAGLAVPDWPLSYGKLMPPMVGGIFYEHGHRMVATFVGLVTVVLAAWISVREKRRWVRRLAWANLAAVIIQGLLGGITVLYFLPPVVSMAHASLAQAFFCLTVTLAVVTGPKWILPPEYPSDTGALRAASIALAAAVYVQLVLGAGTRHNAIGTVPHIIGAGVVAVIAVWLALRGTRYSPREWARQSVLLAAMVGAQVALGIATLVIKIADTGAVQPLPNRIWSATGHVALGALILAATLVLVLRVHRRPPVCVPDPGAVEVAGVPSV
jgi:cytochrome c oxidase assembly protein subunit 15